MDSNIDRVIAEAFALPSDERSEVAVILQDSIEGDIDEAAIAAAWEAETLRRLEEVDSGRVKLVPWEEAKARLLAL